MKIVSSTTLVTGEPNKTVSHPPGTPVDLPDEVAKDLMDRGLARLPGEAPAASAPEIQKPSGKDLTAAIVDAIKLLDPAVEEAWTASGKPSALQLEKILGYQIATEERDTAWAAAQKQGVKGPQAASA